MTKPYTGVSIQNHGSFATTILRWVSTRLLQSLYYICKWLTVLHDRDRNSTKAIPFVH